MVVENARTAATRRPAVEMPFLRHTNSFSADKIGRPLQLYNSLRIGSYEGCYILGESYMAEQLARRAAQAARENAASTSDEIVRAEWLTTAQLWEEIAEEYARHSVPGLDMYCGAVAPAVPTSGRHTNLAA
jgi:hypothetical protein